MNQSNTAIIILAAGKGTRMNSDLPKVLHKVNDKSMLNIIIETSEKLNPNKIIVVVGYKKKLVIDSITNPNIKFVNQDEQLGTAHAIKQCLTELKNFEGKVLILSGDVPLIKKETLEKFLNFHIIKKSKGTLISNLFNDPSGYGRIIKNKSGQLLNIIEDKDANVNQKKIKEINAGIYIFDSKVLIEKIKLIKNENAQNEYYLPDIFNFINVEEKYIYQINDNTQIMGVNTLDHLKNVEKILNA